MDINFDEYNVTYFDTAEELVEAKKRDPNAEVAVLGKDEVFSIVSSSNDTELNRQLAKRLWDMAWNPKSLHPLNKNGLSISHRLSKLK